VRQVPLLLPSRFSLKTVETVEAFVFLRFFVVLEAVTAALTVNVSGGSQDSLPMALSNPACPKC
jgi:hypothetical protein